MEPASKRWGQGRRRAARESMGAPLEGGGEKTGQARASWILLCPYGCWSPSAKSACVSGAEPTLLLWAWPCPPAEGRKSLCFLLRTASQESSRALVLQALNSHVAGSGGEAPWTQRAALAGADVSGGEGEAGLWLAAPMVGPWLRDWRRWEKPYVPEQENDSLWQNWSQI